MQTRDFCWEGANLALEFPGTHPVSRAEDSGWSASALEQSDHRTSQL